MKKKRKGVNQERIEGASSQTWHENGNDYLPFLKYMLGIVVKAYNEFEDRVEYLHHRKMSKADRIKALIEKTPGKISKKQIAQACRTSVSRPLSAPWPGLWPVGLSIKSVSGAPRPTLRNNVENKRIRM